MNELKERTTRLYAFDDLDSIENCLRRLAEREMVMQFQRPGMREPRWGQLLTGPIPEDLPSHAPADSHAHSLAERVAALENEVHTLREQLTELKRMFE